MSTNVKNEYKMDHPKRGTALVINIRLFENNEHNERVYSEKDVENLTHTLKYLEFETFGLNKTFAYNLCTKRSR